MILDLDFGCLCLCVIELLRLGFNSVGMFILLLVVFIVLLVCSVFIMVPVFWCLVVCVCCIDCRALVIAVVCLWLPCFGLVVCPSRC